MIYNDCITNHSKHLNRKNRLKEIFSPGLKLFEAEKYFLFPTFLYNVVYKELLLLALLCRKASQLISKYVCTAVCFQLWKQESKTLPTDDSNSGGSLILQQGYTVRKHPHRCANAHTRPYPVHTSGMCICCKQMQKHCNALGLRFTLRALLKLNHAQANVCEVG